MGENTGCTLWADGENCDPSAPHCDDGSCTACSDDAQCTPFGDLSVCDQENDRACVQCTGTRYATCADGSADYLCDSQTRSCADSEETSDASPCEACISDAHCATGLCGPTTWGDTATGNRCLPVASPDCLRRGFLAYVDLPDEGLTSLDGASDPVCRPRTTSCKGYLAFSTEDCSGADDDGDAMCGEGLADGVCLPLPSGTQFQCSYPALNQKDCKYVPPGGDEAATKDHTRLDINVCSLP